MFKPISPKDKKYGNKGKTLLNTSCNDKKAQWGRETLSDTSVSAKAAKHLSINDNRKGIHKVG
jgi:hypothetical protein